jgi:xanthine dehydrogenase/oxidase
MERIANHQVRNIASIAGNIMLVKNHQAPESGEPFPSDMYTVLATLNATIELIVPDTTAPQSFALIDMPEISNWPKGFLITNISIPLSTKNQHIRTFKISRRNQNAHAIVNAGFCFALDEENKITHANIVYGGIGRIGYKDRITELAILGEKWSREMMIKATKSIIDQATRLIVPMPSTGINEPFRLELTKTLFYQYFVSVSLEVAPDLIDANEVSAGQLFDRPISEGSYNYLAAPYSEATAASMPFTLESMKSSLSLKGISPLLDNKVDASPKDEQSEASNDINSYPTKLTALSQTTGKAKYTHDEHGPSDTLVAFYVYSEFRNGKFNFDCTKNELLEIVKEQYPSVVALITAEDIPYPSDGIDNFSPGSPASYDPIFADTYVTSYGMPIGVLLAKEELEAKQGAALVQSHIIYEKDVDLPTAITIQEAIDIPKDLGIMKGGVEWVERPIAADDPCAEEKKAWLKEPGPVDGKIYVEGQQKTGAQYHFYMEPQGTLAVPAENGQMEVYTSSQHLSSCQDRISFALGIQANKVKAKVIRLGGGFGGKEVRPPNVAAAAAVAANAVHKPVRLMLDRNTDMQMIGNRHPYKGDYYLCAKDDGTIERLKFDFYANAGFSTDCSVPVMDLVLLSAEGAYMVPVFRADGTVCRTNIQTRTAFRSFGLIQCSLIREEAIEKLAHTLALPPEQIRERNLYRDATLDTWEFTPFGQALKFCRINQIWHDFKEKIDFKTRAAAVDEFNKANKWKKRGVSMIPIKYGISYTYRPMNQGYAYVFAYSDDGTVLVHHGGIEMGQGLNTKMAQIAADILGIDLSLVSVGESATNVIPNASSTGASTGADLNGGAVKNACTILRSRLTEFCEAYIADPSDFPDLGSGAIPVDWKENWRTLWTQIISQAYKARIDLGQSAFFGSPDLGELDAEKQVSKDADGNPQQLFYYYSYCVAASEVEINVLTGEHEILRSDIVYDAGKSLNPKIDIGQIEGGFIQGVGNVTTEEIYYAENGMLYPDGTWNYKPPETRNIPIDFNVYILKYVRMDEKTFAPMDHYGIQSSKSTGEPPLVLANTVFFAIKHAIMDFRKAQGHAEWIALESPATIERIQQACKVAGSMND